MDQGSNTTKYAPVPSSEQYPPSYATNPSYPPNNPQNNPQMYPNISEKNPSYQPNNPSYPVGYPSYPPQNQPYAHPNQPYASPNQPYAPQNQPYVVVPGGQYPGGMAPPGPVVVVQARPKISFCAHIALACFVFWCCGWICGLAAFILAMFARGKSEENKVDEARRLGKASIGVSIAGIVTGIIIIIIVIVLRVQAAQQAQQSYDSYNSYKPSG